MGMNDEEKKGLESRLKAIAEDLINERFPEIEGGPREAMVLLFMMAAGQGYRLGMNEAYTPS